MYFCVPEPAGISLKSTDGMVIAPFVAGIQVTLTATPDAKSVFTGWGGLGFWDGLLRGDVGCMPAACFGPSLARVYDLYAKADMAAAWAAFDGQAHFVAWSMQTLDISVWVTKLALLREGVIASVCQRDPATPG